jgi:hypothetical protein
MLNFSSLIPGLATRIPVVFFMDVAPHQRESQSVCRRKFGIVEAGWRNQLERQGLVEKHEEVTMPYSMAPVPGQEPFPGNPVPPPLPPDVDPPIKEPEPDRLPDEEPLPNPDETDKPSKYM